MVMTSGTVSPISPPVRLASTTMKFCSIKHGDQRGQAEIGPAHAQRRQRQHHAAGDRGQSARGDADPDRRLIEIIENARRIGAGADQEGRAEIHLAGEAEQRSQAMANTPK